MRHQAATWRVFSTWNAVATVCGILVCSASLVVPVFGMKESNIGPVETVTRQRDWPHDIEPMLLSKHRVYSMDINGNCYFYYRCPVDGVNLLLSQFADIKLPVHNVTFRPGAPTVEAPEAGAFKYTMCLHLPAGMYLGMAKEQQNEVLFPTVPHVTVYIDEQLASQLDNLRVPEKLTVRGPDDGLEETVAGLASSDSYVRSWAAEALGHMGQAAIPAKEALLKAAGDEDSTVSRAAWRAFRQIESDDVSTALTELVNDFVRSHR